ncbi:hypothetical protein CH262_03310 [Rhodococcus sp. 05-2255-1e]|nr:hypothetical protein CH262_03310 [Rhodococcus sp. 05-2255-1e]
MFECRTCWSARSAGKGHAVEVVLGEGPGEMPVQVQSAFYLVEGIADGRIVWVVAVRSDGCALFVVHVWLDARDGATVPATVIHANDWTTMSAAAVAVQVDRVSNEQGPRTCGARPWSVLGDGVRQCASRQVAARSG